MKRFFCTILVLALVALNLQAQTIKGSFSALREQSRVRLEVDFSGAEIHGMSEEDFARYETDWEKDKPEVVAKIIRECNEAIRGSVRVGQYKDARYMIVLKVRAISDHGDFDCDAVLLDEEGKEVGAIDGLWGRGGKFGTKLNLIKDGAERVGDCLGRYLQRAINESPRVYSI